MAQLTGLNLDTAEALQVVNYGMGGHYEPHIDFAGVSYEQPVEHRYRATLGLTTLKPGTHYRTPFWSFPTPSFGMLTLDPSLPRLRQFTKHEYSRYTYNTAALRGRSG